MRIALAQSNLDKAEEVKKVAETFAPSRESVDSVKQWLESSGIASGRISKSQ